MDGGATTQEAIEAYAKHSGETLGMVQRRARAMREAGGEGGDNLDLWLGATKPGGGKNAARPTARHLVNLVLSFATERPADVPELVTRMRKWVPRPGSAVQAWVEPVIPNALMQMAKGAETEFGVETRSIRVDTGAVTRLPLGPYFEERISGGTPHEIPGLGIAIPDRLVVDAGVGFAQLYFRISSTGAGKGYVFCQPFLSLEVFQRHWNAPGRVERTATIPANFFDLAAELLAPSATSGGLPSPSSDDPAASGSDEDGNDGVSSAEAARPETKNGAAGALPGATAAPSNTGVQPRANGTSYSHSAQNREREEFSQSLFVRGRLDIPLNLSRQRRLGAQPHVLAVP